MSTNVGTLVQFVSAGVLPTPRELGGGASQVPVHGALERDLTTHLLHEEMADEARHADVTSGGFEPCPARGLIIEGHRDVPHDTILV